jgi:hypothetical protein
MINFIEAHVGKIAAQIQSLGTSFDPEVLALPGGSIIAVFLWLHAHARRPRKHVACPL